MRKYPERHGIDLLISQYRNSPNLIKYISILLSECQLLDIVFEAIVLGRRLDIAKGQQLDDIAVIVGTSRIVYGADPLGYFGYYDNPQANGIGIGYFKSDDDKDSGDLILTDPMLRNRIRARVIKTMGNSCIEDVLEYCDLLLSRKLDLEIQEEEATCHLIYHGTLDNADKALLANVIPDIKVVGVTFTLQDDAGDIEIIYESKDFPEGI